MTDIVERLRSAPFSPEKVQVMREDAADEIERLKASVNNGLEIVGRQEIEIERLQKALKTSKATKDGYYNQIVRLLSRIDENAAGGT